MGITFIILAAVVTAFSADWICSGGDPGRSFNSPDTIIKAPLKVKWRIRTPGYMQSNPVIAGNRVFVRFQSSPVVMAVDAETGDILWRKTDNMGAGQNKVTFSWGDGLCFYQGRIYYQSLMTSPAAVKQYHLYCRDAATGDSLWCRLIPENCGSPMTNHAKSSPLVYDNVAVVSGANQFDDSAAYTGFNAQTGDLLWMIKQKYAGEKVSHVLPAIDTARGLVFGGFHSATRGMFFAASLRTGDTLSGWTRHGVHEGKYVQCRNGRVFYTGDGNTAILEAATGAIIDTSATFFNCRELAIGDDYIIKGGYNMPLRVYDQSFKLLGTSTVFGAHNGLGKCGGPLLANGYLWRSAKTGSGAYPTGKHITAACLDAIVSKDMSGTRCKGADDWMLWGVGGCSTASIVNGKLYNVVFGAWLYCFENE